MVQIASGMGFKYTMTDKAESKNKMSSKKLQQLLEQDKSERLQSCRSEIEVVLQKYKCQLIALPGIDVEGRVIAEVQVAITS